MGFLRRLWRWITGARTAAVIAPATPQKRVRRVRRPIDPAVLDIPQYAPKLIAPPEPKRRRRARSTALLNEIFYLGRGVSHGLSDRRADVERLQQLGLPVLASPHEIAEALGISVTRLRWLAFHAEVSPVSHYVWFEVPKRTGGVRTLASPHADLKRCQAWILERILSRVPVHPAAHGFVPGRSILTNAAPHVGSAIILNADLEDFFPTITFPRVRGVFHKLGYSPAAATILALLCTECSRRTVLFRGQKLFVAVEPRGLPQGACTSPALSNLVCRRLDARLSGLAAKHGWKYTRYADDLTFSCHEDRETHVGTLLARLCRIARDEGFRMNESKTRVLRRNAAQIVTGLVVNEKIQVPRRMRRQIRAILHNIERTGLTAQNRHGNPYFAEHLRGLVAYLSMVQTFSEGDRSAKSA